MLVNDLRTVVPAVIAVFLAGCVSKPAPHALTPPDGAGGAFANVSKAPVSTEESPTAWWRLFDDPALDELIADAIAENNDLKAAAANLKSVRAALNAERAVLFPATTVSAGADYARLGGGAAGPLSSVDDDFVYSTGFDLSYELDLFGRVRNIVAAARADLGAAEAALNDLAVIVAAETARAYAEFCAAEVQIGVAEESAALQEETFKLTQRLLDAGRATRLDVARAQSALETTRASIPPLRAAGESAVFRLATLTGRTPKTMLSTIGACDAIPAVTREIPVGDGYALLARRPDVRRAEHILASATARVGAARADLFPQVTLGGSVTSSALEVSNIGSDDSIQFSVGPLITWSFPNIAVAKARLSGAKADAEAALASYNQTVLTALEETETALSRLGRALERAASLERARDAAAEAAELALARYRAGRDPFLTVLDADRTLAESEAALAQARAAAANAQVDVFRALGGGWQALWQNAG
ncbi:efflux transporter outer membrane subunit [Hyphococcus luteus]|uniref:RND transporter n=1 Tax=Hyphococcus luteus TaxID=2058213 RepID=A0A2S7K299_9PROT|nr:TolC family protein [Marinicaulis flavus]PQA86645.1 RND transporter [Marinicaulis flavus]